MVNCLLYQLSIHNTTHCWCILFHVVSNLTAALSFTEGLTLGIFVHYIPLSCTSSPCNLLFLNPGVYSLVQATVGLGTVLILYFCIAYTRAARISLYQGWRGCVAQFLQASCSLTCLIPPKPPLGSWSNVSNRPGPVPKTTFLWLQGSGSEPLQGHLTCSPLCHPAMHSAVSFSLQSFVPPLHTGKPTGAWQSPAAFGFRLSSPSHYVSGPLSQSFVGSSLNWTALNLDPSSTIPWAG